jgi:hypothetical protein
MLRLIPWSTPALQTGIGQFAFEGYPLAIVRLAPDSVRRLPICDLKSADDPEQVAAIQHDLPDLELVRGGHGARGSAPEWRSRDRHETGYF